MGLSIIVPSIRHEILPRFTESIPAAVGNRAWELLVVSPSFDDRIMEHLATLLDHHNCKRVVTIEDEGSPSRCLQRASELLNFPTFTWGTDDGIYKPDVLGQCVELLNEKPHKDGVIIKYTEEGPGTFTGALDAYYVSENHDANRQPGIPGHFKIAPVGMFSTSYWQQMGGIDCRFDHINMNVHDFVYRLQHDGGELHYSPDVVMHCDSDNWGADHRVLDVAYQQNDLPLFVDLYKDDSRRGPIDLHNWQLADPVWRRFQKN